jgi:hypothetical protein
MTGVALRVRRAWTAARRAEAKAFEKWNGRVDRRISLVVGSLLMIWGIGEATSRLHMRVGFYTVLAQVLPVLILAVVVDGRYFRGVRRRPAFDRFFLRGLLLFPAIAEVGALAAVAAGRDTTLLRGVTLFGCGVTLLLLFVLAVDGPATAMGPGRSAVLDAVEELKAARGSSRPPTAR